jgi:hypothetical protein
VMAAGDPEQRHLVAISLEKAVKMGVRQRADTGVGPLRH